MDTILKYILAAAIGALSSVLANRNVAVYNDGFRPVYAEYFGGRMDRKALAATSFAVSFGLIIGFGFTNSIAMGIIIIHTFLLMGDVIGTIFPDTRTGTLLSAVVGAAWGLIVVLFMGGISDAFAMLPVNFMGNMGAVSDIVVACFAIFPALAVAYQHGAKKGVITAAVTVAVYVLISRFGKFSIGERTVSLNASGMAMLVATIIMIVLAVRKKQEALDSGLSNLFAENVNRIKGNWYWFAVMGGLLSAGASVLLLCTDVISGPLMLQGMHGDAALVAFVRAIGYIPLVYTTAIVTGVFSPAGSYFCVAFGMLSASFGLGTLPTALIAFVGGAIVMVIETAALGAMGKFLDRYPALRDLGDHIRNAMSQVLEVALLVGGFVASKAIMAQVGLGYVGSMAVMITWLINKSAKKPLLVPLAVGPVVTIAMGILANILFLLGWPLAA